jgi:putative glutamine amidotransferase
VLLGKHEDEAVRPLIGLTTHRTRLAVNLSGAQSVDLIAAAHADAIVEHGGQPVLIPLGATSDIERLVAAIDGLLLSSGPDVAPAIYGQRCEVRYDAANGVVGKPYARGAGLAPDPARDADEIRLYRAARAKGVPILGICRGMQLMNVAEGGTLYQEVPEAEVKHCLEPDGWIPYHSVDVQAGSRIREILGTERCFVPSLHHQGVHAVAECFRVVGTAPDGLAEIIEAETGFVVGVQAHIERSGKNLPELGRIYRAFVKEAKCSLQ